MSSSLRNPCWCLTTAWIKTMMTTSCNFWYSTQIIRAVMRCGLEWTQFQEKLSVQVPFSSFGNFGHAVKPYIFWVTDVCITHFAGLKRKRQIKTKTAPTVKEFLQQGILNVHSFGSSLIVRWLYSVWMFIAWL